MTPRVSVVIPCRNERATLSACLDALAWQTVPRDALEVLLVDGGSTDGCRDVARDYGVRVLHDHGAGPSAARNVGVREAQARLVAFTDADCVPERDWIERIEQVFAERPHLAGVGGALRMPRRTLVGRMEDHDARAHYRGFITSNVAYRKDALLAVGGFDESLKCAEDYDLAWRVRDAGFDVVHDRRPVVMHDPPEVSGSVASYLRKQYWYARHDLPAHVRAWRRWRDDPEGAPGSREAVGGLRDAAKPAAFALALGAGALVGEPWLVGAALGGLTSRAIRRVAKSGARGVEVVPMAAIALAKDVARGAGTLSGAMALARGVRLTRGEQARGSAKPPAPPLPA